MASSAQTAIFLHTDIERLLGGGFKAMGAAPDFQKLGTNFFIWNSEGDRKDQRETKTSHQRNPLIFIFAPC